MAKDVVRVAATTAVNSENVTIASVRSVLRGLGDRTQVQRFPRNAKSRKVARWVTVYIGVRRYHLGSSPPDELLR